MALKVISFINMKGGVGKTTLAVNIGYTLAEIHGKKILLVDIDPQFSATQYLMGMEKYAKYINNKDKDNRTVLDIFKDRRITTNISTVIDGKDRVQKVPPVSLDNVSVNIYQSGEGRLDLIPSTIQLQELEIAPRATENKLNLFLRKISNAYDFIIIDCPPTVSVFTFSAYIASEGYVVPVKPDPISTTGLPTLELLLDSYEDRTGSRIKQIGIIFTMFRNTITERQQIRNISSNESRRILQNSLSYSIEIAKAVQYMQPVRVKKYREQFQAITEEFLEVVEEVQSDE